MTESEKIPIDFVAKGNMYSLCIMEKGDSE